MNKEEIKDIVAKITFALETTKATLNMVIADHEDEPISWVLCGVKEQLSPIEKVADQLDKLTIEP